MPKRTSPLIATAAGPRTARRVPRLARCETDVINSRETCVRVWACTGASAGVVTPFCPISVVLGRAVTPYCMAALVAKQERGDARRPHDQISSPPPAPSDRTGTGGRIPWAVLAIPRRSRASAHAAGWARNRCVSIALSDRAPQRPWSRRYNHALPSRHVLPSEASLRHSAGARPRCPGPSCANSRSTDRHR